MAEKTAWAAQRNRNHLAEIIALIERNNREMEDVLREDDNER